VGTTIHAAASPYTGGVPDIWILIVVAAFIFAGVRAARQAQVRTARSAWVEAADRLGLAMTGTGREGLSISGRDGGLTVDVSVRQTAGEDNRVLTRYDVGLPSGVGMSLSSAAGWQGVVSAFGGQDVEIGDPAFDARFILKTNNPDRIRRYLTPPRVAALKGLHDQHRGFVLTDDSLVLETPGIAAAADEITSTVTHLLTTGRALLMDQEESDRVMMGEFYDRAPGRDEAKADPGERASGAAAEDAGERDEELQRVFDTMEEYTGAEAPREADRPADEHFAPTAPTPPIPPDPDALAIATRLFGKDQLGFEVQRIFDEEFRGRSITWSGKVKRPAGLMATRAFDGGDLEVLIIEVAAVPNELYGTSTIDAIVAFPNGAAPRQGESVRFTGTLLKVDGVNKELYVTGGRLS
jgi:hypothetical protein